MLSIHMIERLFDGGSFDRLLNAVAANGLELPLPLRVRLSQAPAGAVALGLRRVVELTYGPTALSGRMTRFLLDVQHADGSFGDDPAITAAAAAALGRLLAEQPPAPALAVAQARQTALAALAAMQADDGLFDVGIERSLEDRALTAAFVLLLLGGDETFHQAVRSAELCRWFEQRHGRLDRLTERLWRMSRAETRVPRRPNAAVAA